MADTENIDEWNEFLAGEALVFELLGRLLYDEPDKVWLQNLIDQDVFEDIPLGAEQEETGRGLGLLQKWAQANRPGLSDAAFDDVRVDNTRLFIGVGMVLAPLWESVYFGDARLIFQEQTLQVRSWYRRFGLEFEKLNQEPDDHIGLEMAFVSQLASLALEKLEAGDQPGFEEALQAQRDFLSEHLLRWGPAWAKLVEEYARTDFYRGLAHLTHGALLAVAAQLEIKLPKEAAR